MGALIKNSRESSDPGSFKLEELLKEKGLSKNKLSHRAEMQRTQINNYCKNQISRLDIDVLARICTVLECSIEDLLEFVPEEGQA